MIFVFNLDLFTVGLAVAASAILGFTIFFNKPFSITNRTFLYFTIVSGLWGILNYFIYQPYHDANISIILIRLTVFLAVWQAFFIFRFFLVFPKDKYFFAKSYRLVLLPLVFITSLLTLTPFVFESINSFTQEGVVDKVNNGPGIILFGLVSVGLVISSIALLIIKIKKSAAEIKQPLKIILMGIGSTFLLIIVFNFIFPAFLNNSTYIPFGTLFLLPFILLTFYAIFRHTLLNTKIIGTEILVLFLTIFSFLEILVSQNFFEVIFRSGIFILLLIFSVALIKSVINEVKTREQIQTLAKNLEKANEKLKQLDMFKSEFLSIASHQLRTPLTILKGYTSLAKEGNFGEFTEKQKEMIEKLSVSTERLIALVEDLLDISRLEKGKVEYNFQIKNIEPLAEEIYNELKPKAIAKGLEITFKKPEQLLPKVRIDPSKMHEVIFNIVDNAIKYTEKGGIVIELKQIDSAITIDVTDTGIGITPEELASLFQKFVRGTRVSQLYTEGTGLGLYYAKRVTEDHQGRISASSPGPGKGSTFHIELPIVKD